jgi:hypothetical protein
MSDRSGEEDHGKEKDLSPGGRATSSESEPVGVISATVGDPRGWVSIGRYRFLISGD